MTVNVNGFVAENGEFAPRESGMSRTVTNGGQSSHSGVTVVSSCTDVWTP